MKQEILGLDKETIQEWEMVVRYLTQNKYRFQMTIGEQVRYLTVEINKAMNEIFFARDRKEMIHLQKIGITLIGYKNRLKKLLI